jgi:hypothetical protein
MDELEADYLVHHSASYVPINSFGIASSGEVQLMAQAPEYTSCSAWTIGSHDSPRAQPGETISRRGPALGHQQGKGFPDLHRIRHHLSCMIDVNVAATMAAMFGKKAAH